MFVDDTSFNAEDVTSTRTMPISTKGQAVDSDDSVRIVRVLVPAESLPDWVVPVMAALGGLLLVAVCCCIWFAVRQRPAGAPSSEAANVGGAEVQGAQNNGPVDASRYESVPPLSQEEHYANAPNPNQYEAFHSARHDDGPPDHYSDLQLQGHGAPAPAPQTHYSEMY